MYYANAIALPPKTLSEEEQQLLLKTTGEHARGYRDHVIFAVGLGTALREHEILALNIGDVFNDAGKSRPRVQLKVFKRSNDNTAAQEVFLPDTLRLKLDKFYGWKKRRGQSLDPEAPLFVSRKGNRLSTRQLRELFAVWQERAGFDRRLSFHSVRHTALTAVYRRSRDIRLTQRVARHKSINSTIRYAGPTDEDVFRTVRGLPC